MTITRKNIKKKLIQNKWIGTTIDMPGRNSLARDIFGDNLVFTFSKFGSCKLELPKRTICARWRLKDMEVYFRGKDLKTKAFLRMYKSIDDFYYFDLYNIENYMVSFYTKDYLDKASSTSAKEE